MLMRHRRPLRTATLLVAFAITPAQALAQQPAQTAAVREVFLSTGPGILWHGDDRLGSGLTWGVGATLPVARRLAVRLSAEQAIGPPPTERSCLSYDAPCAGVGHYGVRNLMVMSAAAAYYFSGGLAQPYLVGGLDVLHFTFVSDVTYLNRNPIIIDEFEMRHTTMGILVGGGLRVPVGRMSITTELTIYDGTMLSGANLTQLRTAIAAGYRF